MEIARNFCFITGLLDGAHELGRNRDLKLIHKEEQDLWQVANSKSRAMVRTNRRKYDFWIDTCEASQQYANMTIEHTNAIYRQLRYFNWFFSPIMLSNDTLHLLPISIWMHKGNLYSAQLQKKRRNSTRQQPVCQLTVSLLPSILLVSLCQLFSYDQLWNVYPVAKQIRYNLLSILDGTSRISIDEYFVQAAVDEIGHKRAVVPANSFDTLAVDLVMDVRFREVQTGVSFLVDKKIREINL